MYQNYYQEVSNNFGINTVKELIHNRFEKFRISYIGLPKNRNPQSPRNPLKSDVG